MSHVSATKTSTRLRLLGAASMMKKIYFGKTDTTRYAQLRFEAYRRV
jgi:hypothetical protein